MSEASLAAPIDALTGLWRAAALDESALRRVQLDGHEPVLTSSFAVGTAAQAGIAAAALAATEVGRWRNGVVQQVAVEMRHAALECCSWFRIDGREPVIWDALAGLYPCAGGGWVRLHTNFEHHRDAALRLLGLPPGPGTPRAQVEQALRGWHALDFEQAAADGGAVAAALRGFDEWDAHAQGRATAAQPLVRSERVGDSPPRPLPALDAGAPPLHGLRVLDLTRILAGPVGTRALAAYGADVLLVNAPHLPNIEAIAETSRGKLSAFADLRQPASRAAFERVFADTLVQTASGFNRAEAQAMGQSTPRALPMQILDHATGYAAALGACAALLRQHRGGGSWQVQVSLAATGRWLRSLGRVSEGFDLPPPDLAPYLETTASGFGELLAVRHAARLSATPARWQRRSMPPGLHPLAWP